MTSKLVNLRLIDFLLSCQFVDFKKEQTGIFEKLLLKVDFSWSRLLVIAGSIKSNQCLCLCNHMLNFGHVKIPIEKCIFEWKILN